MYLISLYWSIVRWWRVLTFAVAWSTDGTDQPYDRMIDAFRPQVRMRKLPLRRMGENTNSFGSPITTLMSHHGKATWISVSRIPQFIKMVQTSRRAVILIRFWLEVWSRCENFWISKTLPSFLCKNFWNKPFYFWNKKGVVTYSRHLLAFHERQQSSQHLWNRKSNLGGILHPCWAIGDPCSEVHVKCASEKRRLK